MAGYPRSRRCAWESLMHLLEGQSFTQSDLIALSGLTAAAVTTGLYRLRQMGILETRTFRAASAKGRPRAIYSLTSAA